MKKSVQIKYTQFTETFDIKSDENGSLEIELKDISPELEKVSGSLVMDLSTNFREAYSDFPFVNGDLSVIQVDNVFIVSAHQGENIHWLKFDSSQIFSYLIKNPVLDEIIPYINEDQHIFLNSVLSDFVRNDYSFNDINKKIKFAKVAVLMAFIKDYLKGDFKRVILDETVLGDIDVDNIPMAFRFAEKQVLGVLKIENLTKIIVALEKNKDLETKFEFQEKVLFVNNLNNANKIRLSLDNHGKRFDYEVLPQKNYIFDIGDEEFTMELGHLIERKATGKVCVYNGDIRDLMIS